MRSGQQGQRRQVYQGSGHYAPVNMSVQDGPAAEGRPSCWARLRGRRLTTRDIATIAVLAALGGVMSSYVGFLGTSLNRLIGVPMGAGQPLAGLHVFWMVLAVVLTDRVGVGTSTGLLKGLVEMLSGSSKGALVVLLSLVAGLLVDLVWAASPRRGAITTAVAGGVSAASNIVVFLLFTSTYSGLMWLFLVLLVVAFASGVVLGGLLVTNVARTLELAGLLVRAGDGGGTAGRAARGARRWAPVTVTVAAAVLFFGGAFLYYPMLIGNVEQVEEGTIEVRGLVDSPYSFDLEDFSGQLVTVEAELVGDFTHEPRQNYTGVPLRAVLERASIRPSATTVHVVGADGYGAQLDFDLEEVMDSLNASAFILVKAHGTLPGGGEGDYVRLVCRDLAGGWWVGWVVRVEVA